MFHRRLFLFLLVLGGVLTTRSYARLFKSDSEDYRLIGIQVEQQSSLNACAPATMASVLRYYGIETNQQKLAHEIGYSNKTGTDVEAMLNHIAKHYASQNISVQTHIGFDYQRYKDIITRYNEYVDEQGGKRLWFADSGYLDLARTFSNAQIEILREVASTRDYKRFKKNVEKAIKNDIPLVWGIILGVAQDPVLSRVSPGGHLRLIVGYNEKKGEIIFSDPWGPKHQYKRMPMHDAFLITMSLHTLSKE